MKPRIDFSAAPAGALQAMQGLDSFVRQSGIEPKLNELIKVRASLINGCAYCLDMHTKDARAHGETEQRLYGLNAWRETPYYSDRERAALEWTDALTLISENDVPDDLYERVRAQFSEPELIGLTFAIITINAWNRIAIPFRAVPGSYQRPQPAARTA